MFWLFASSSVIVVLCVALSCFIDCCCKRVVRKNVEVQHSHDNGQVGVKDCEGGWTY